MDDDEDGSKVSLYETELFQFYKSVFWNIFCMFVLLLLLLLLVTKYMQLPVKCMLGAC